jgi:drug/metabolite transporter (DMT)-like permease
MESEKYFPSWKGNAATPEEPSVNADEAAQSLATIRDTQTRAVRSQPWFPTWYVVGVSLFVAGMQLVTEPGVPGPLSGGVAVLLCAVLGAMVAVLVKTRRMTAHRSLLPPGGFVVFGVWLAACVALCLILALRWHTAEIAYARTYAALVMTAFVAATGPLVSRGISRMIARKIEKGA